MNKKKYGVYLTMYSPFENLIFKEWMSKYINDEDIILEPFAGENNIIEMMENAGFSNKWVCYDVNPPKINKTPKYTVNKLNTINNFPQSYKVVITNPPYLARNSAKRNNIKFIKSKYDNLYKAALDKVLKKTDYVAAIIPESFITQNLFHNRLHSVISINYKLFDDTNFPVCLALFVKKIDKDKPMLNDFFIYKNNDYIDKYSNILKVEKNHIKKINSKLKYIEIYKGWDFNNENGNIGLYAVDNCFEKSIKFVKSNSMDVNLIIKDTSRCLTKINNKNLNYDILNLDLLIDLFNKNLEKYRDETKDMLMTAFRNLTKDGEYRRRLDYKTAKLILTISMIELIETKKLLI